MTARVHLRALALSLCVGAVACHAGTTYVWWEAEEPDYSSYPEERTGFEPQDERERAVLSAGDWLTIRSSLEDQRQLRYTIDVPSPGTWRFYVRKFWKHGPFRWRFDTQEWRSVTRDITLLDSVILRHLVCANWVLAGEVTLAAGPHTVTIELLPGDNTIGVFDAFLLTRGTFVPRGKLKPGEKLGLTDPGMWAFEPVPDTFADNAVLDLRSLNEDFAGQSGPVRLSADGNNFVLGDGTPVKFWNATTFANRMDSFDDLEWHARFLAKRGVNLVKFHDYPYPKGRDSAIDEVDERALDWCWRLVAAMKREGIYTQVSPYWSANINYVPERWGIPGWSGDTSPFALLFFDEALQAGYKTWMRALFLRTNSYTGIPLAEDPAVMSIIVQTEDSMLFYTIGQLQGAQRARLRRTFGTWLSAKYGSLAAATNAWSGKTHENDDFEQAEVGLYHIWQMTSDADAYGGQDEALQRRLDDQLQFYAETMRAFNGMMREFYRDELGCKCLLVSGNWRTADNARLLDAERWSYATNEIMAVQRYTGPVHVNTNTPRRARHAVDAGSFFAEEPVVTHPWKLPIAVRQVAGHPFMNTESTWVSPTRYQAEGPFLVAAYGSLTGIDGYNFFALDGLQYDQQMTKFQVANPSILGMFPASALIYRRGYVEEAGPVVAEHRRLDDIWQRREPLVAEGSGFDPNRDLTRDTTGLSTSMAVSPLAYLVGPVRVSYGSEATSNHVAEMDQYIDTSARTVSSATDELQLDYGRGLCTLNAPKAQGTCGFHTGAPERLADVTIVCSNSYASITVVPLDDHAISESTNLLVQVGTVSRPYGWRTEPAEFEDPGSTQSYTGTRIVSVGGPPWNVERADIRVGIGNPKLRSVHMLDANGMVTGTVPARREKGVLGFTFPADALYVVVR